MIRYRNLKEGKIKNKEDVFDLKLLKKELDGLFRGENPVGNVISTPLYKVGYPRIDIFPNKKIRPNSYFLVSDAKIILNYLNSINGLSVEPQEFKKIKDAEKRGDILGDEHGFSLDISIHTMPPERKDYKEWPVRSS